jgi:hypothetical protein
MKVVTLLTGPAMLVYMTITILSHQDHPGKVFCYYGYFNIMFNVSYWQLQSFFVALFRYLCIVHNESLASIGITAKVSLAFCYQIIFKMLVPVLETCKCSCFCKYSGSLCDRVTNSSSVPSVKFNID